MFLIFAAQVYTAAAKFLAEKGLGKCRGISERDFDTLNSLNALQSLYNGAKTSELRVLDDVKMMELEAITNMFIDALKMYVSPLELRLPTKYNPMSEYKILCDETLKATAVKDQSSNLDEKLIYETQVLAVIALLCTEFPNATQMLLFKKCETGATDNNDNGDADGENRIGSFVDILTDVLCAIGHSVTFKLGEFFVTFFFHFEYISFFFSCNRKRCHHIKVSLNRHHCSWLHWPKPTVQPIRAICFF